MIDPFAVSQLREQIDILAERIAAGRAIWMQPELDRLRAKLSKAEAR